MKATYVCNFCQATLAPGARWCPRCLKGTGETRTSVEGARSAHEGYLPPDSVPATHGGQAVQASLNLPTTRVKATATTFGPWTRVLISLALVAPFLVAFYLSQVVGIMVLMVVAPTLIYIPFAIKVFRATWGVGRFDATEASEDDGPDPDGPAT